MRSLSVIPLEVFELVEVLCPEIDLLVGSVIVSVELML